MSFYGPVTEMTTEQLEYWAAQPSSMDIMQEHNQACAISRELFRRKNPEAYAAQQEKERKAKEIEALKHGLRKIEENRRFAEVLAVPRTKPAKVTPTEELRFDRQVIEGNIVSVKMKDTQYGAVNKVIVQLDNGNRVYGSLPSKIGEALYSAIPGNLTYGGPWHTVDEDRLARIKQNIACGRRIKFLALVEPSNDDPNFGFFSRPTKPELVS